MPQIALVHDVFFQPDGRSRLIDTLGEARDRGAVLAVLPELPCDPWYPAERVSGEGAAEEWEDAGGARHALLSQASAEVGLGLVGGAIVRDPQSGRRHGTALVFDAAGTLAASYAKIHLPQEPGFWERDHYDPGLGPPKPTQVCGLCLGVQICSDLNRPQGIALLAAQGVELVAGPRATERATWGRWRMVLRASALTTGSFLVSVNRPGPERGVAIGGPSIAIDPDGEVLAETEDRLSIVDLDLKHVARARAGYPGYLEHGGQVYARGWAALASSAPG